MPMSRRVEPVAGSPVIDVNVRDQLVVLILEDGRTLTAPIGWAGPALATVGASIQSEWVLTDDRRGVNWPAAGLMSPQGALNVWALEQDALFDQALRDLERADWNTAALVPRSRSLISLWRLVADGYNGGLRQFFGNWGTTELHSTLIALAEIGAKRTHGIVLEFSEVVSSLVALDDTATFDEVCAGMPADTCLRLDELDEAFWESADELTHLVPAAYGPVLP